MPTDPTVQMNKAQGRDWSWVTLSHREDSRPELLTPRPVAFLPSTPAALFSTGHRAQVSVLEAGAGDMAITEEKLVCELAGELSLPHFQEMRYVHQGPDSKQMAPQIGSFEERFTKGRLQSCGQGVGNVRDGTGLWKRGSVPIPGLKGKEPHREPRGQESSVEGRALGAMPSAKGRGQPTATPQRGSKE